MLTNTELSFHEAIRSGDAAARLIYADWLEDQSRYYESALLRSGHWCLIPAGFFWTGGDRGYPDKLIGKIPRYFYLGAYPVIQGQWEKVMGNNPSYFSRDGGGKDAVKDISDADLRLFPVEGMSWDQAQEFIKELNDKEHDSGFLYRLPTELEWVFGCRGALLPKEYNSNYPAQTRLKGACLQRPTKVGSYRSNRLGLYDMHGNVSEWCAADNMDTRKVARGCSWRDVELQYPVGMSIRLHSYVKANDLGFRLAVSPPTH